MRRSTESSHTVALLALLLLCPLCFGNPAELDDVKFVFLLARHGERVPCHYFPFPGLPPEFVGRKCELTLNGRRQHFLLGQFLRQRYPLLLSSQLIQDEVLIRSSATDRTLMSANYFSYGLYQRSEGQLPILPPIFSSPKKYDSLLKVSSPCPAFKRLVSDTLNADSAIAFAKRELLLYNTLQKIADLKFIPEQPHLHLTTVWELCDVLYVWNYLKPHAVPDWLDASLVSGCSRALAFKQQLRFSTSSLTRLRGGPLVAHVLDMLRKRSAIVDHLDTPTSTGSSATAFNFVNSALDGTDPLDIPKERGSKLVAYFAHDSTLAAFLSHLGIFNNLIPPFAAAVILELYHNRTGDPQVRILYRNDTINGASEPVELWPAVCSETTKATDASGYCRLATLEGAFKNTASFDLDVDCRLPESAIPSASPVLSPAHCAISAFLLSCVLIGTRSKAYLIVSPLVVFLSCPLAFRGQC
ncbi:mitochondrial acyl carrier protein [Sparganum proliferum]